ncbi:hypothetical protein V6Z12_A07G069900 [Gossypium hirsutum]
MCVRMLLIYIHPLHIQDIQTQKILMGAKFVMSSIIFQLIR